MKAVTHALALGLNRRVSTEGSCNGFFVAPTSTVLRTLASTYVCGGAEGKRISLTQGERLHEGSAPSDKQGLGLTDTQVSGHCTGQIPALINKAAEHIKGRTPMWITCGLELDRRYRPMSIIIV